MSEMEKKPNQEVRFESASDVAYRIMTKKILDGEFKAGERLTHRRMARITGTSTIPVISALKQLEEDNLVESRPQWGSYVTVPTLDRIKKSYQFREAIECQTARIMSSQITVAEKDHLYTIASELDTTPYTEESTEFMRERHVKFHNDLTAFTGNNFLIDSLRRINLFWILWSALRETRPRVKTPRYWHCKLVDAIAGGDPDIAERTMREHIYDSFNPIIRNWKGP